ncbi:HAD family hydrolase [Adhaeribacter radiodurans]|uniref:HAD family hydrolase n=1 Tax=Adhaeribacter radiodurans TaxID=2745197 RepID=A0A7L7L3G0_9BACT|nr:HAD family hydrolase [Adhaeribacter radiodurans]QMU27341.1 HAD family hydrolase [Adhaeribacter radiodurans]
MRFNENTFVVFDLDDTIYQEIDFLRSAYRHIAGLLQPSVKKDLFDEMWFRYTNKENVFEWLMKEHASLLPNITISFLLNEYRSHLPQITLSEDALEFLDYLKEAKILCGLITDGRSITQRNKLKALGIETYFADIIISEEFGSEKPNERNFLFFEQKYSDKEFYYIGDNTAKDFIVPAKLGWHTVCLENNGQNIHSQDFRREPIPTVIIRSFKELMPIVVSQSSS